MSSQELKRPKKVPLHTLSQEVQDKLKELSEEEDLKSSEVDIVAAKEEELELVLVVKPESVSLEAKVNNDRILYLYTSYIQTFDLCSMLNIFVTLCQ